MKAHISSRWAILKDQVLNHAQAGEELNAGPLFFIKTQWNSNKQNKIRQKRPELFESTRVGKEKWKRCRWLDWRHVLLLFREFSLPEIAKMFTAYEKNDPNHTRWPRLCHSSPDTQAIGALHRLAVPQEEAALVSKPLQQSLCGSAPDAAKVEGPDQRPFHLHAEHRATACGLRQGVAIHVYVERVRRQKTSGLGFHTSFIQVQHIFSLCRLRSCVLVWTCFPPPPLFTSSCPTRTNKKCYKSYLILSKRATCFNGTKCDCIYFVI